MWLDIYLVASMGLLDGEICMKYGCFKCCIKTEMPLTEDDIRRIESLGYRREQFVVVKGGIPRLRNKNGKCVFLGEDGKCIIYKHRPLGCRLYPVIQVNGGCDVDHEYCPYAHMITKEEIEYACPKVLELNRILNENKKY